MEPALSGLRNNTIPIREISGTSSPLDVDKTRHPRAETPRRVTSPLNHKENLVKLAVLMGILLFMSDWYLPVATAQEPRQGWLDEVLDVHSSCVIADLFTGEYFNKVYADMGFPPLLSQWMASNQKEVGTS